MNTIPLPGCTPEPLMNYLKSLGVLRIIADEQAGPDPDARASWRNGVFTLRTTLDLEGVSDFLLSEFRPTPILSPWQGGGGFLSEKGASKKLLDSFSTSDSERLTGLRDGILSSRKIHVLHRFGELRQQEAAYNKEKKKRELSDEEKNQHKAIKSERENLKESIIFDLRNQVPETALPWLDTCLTGGADAIRNAPHMGTGGNIGKLDISTNYLKNLKHLLDKPIQSRSWLAMSLTGANSGKLQKTKVGQFAPGQAGGANSTQGSEGESAINPWDFVLMLEGSLFLAGSTSRKMGAPTTSGQSFPFTVKSTPVGAIPMSTGDDAKSNGELWLPLWSRPYSFAECLHLFAEGRSELADKRSATGLDFARSVASLGIDRGIESFVRFSFVEYVTAGFMAIPLGRFHVAVKDDASLLQDIDRWLAIYRRACGDKATARFRASLREIESAIFEFCRFGNEGQNRFQSVLISLGRAEHLISRAPRHQDTDAKGLQPLGPLRESWVRAADDSSPDSPEFRLALAIASIGNRATGRFRHHLEDIALRESGRGYIWRKNHSAVWSEGTLAANLERVLARRVMEGKRRDNGGDEPFPPSRQEHEDSEKDAASKLHPLAATQRVPLWVVADFINGRLDDRRIADLIRGLSLCRVDRYSPRHLPRSPSDQLPLPPAYALLKLLFCDLSCRDENGEPILPDATIPALLRANRVPEACRRAIRRLRGKGVFAKPQAMHGFSARDDEWSDAAWPGLDPTRLAAALLIPIGHEASAELRDRILRDPKQDSDSSII